MTYQFELEKKRLWALGIGAFLLGGTLFFLGFFTALLLNRPTVPTATTRTSGPALKPTAIAPAAKETSLAHTSTASTAAPGTADVAASSVPASSAASPSGAALQLAVQVGRFADPAQAKQVAEQLKKQGFSPVIAAQVGASNQQISVVEVGPFSTWEEASQAVRLMGNSVGGRPAIRPML